MIKSIVKTFLTKSLKSVFLKLFVKSLLYWGTKAQRKITKKITKITKQEKAVNIYTLSVLCFIWDPLKAQS